MGSRIAGYRIDGLAGRGGMGTVYRATQIKLERVVALKVIGGDAARDPDFRARFKRESLIAASVEHPNVIPVIEADDEDDYVFISMRYVEGSDLAREIRTGGPLPADLAIRIVEQTAAGLAAAHARGLVHRDVKPANVLLADVHEHPHVYVTDFGIACRTQDTRVTATGVLLGTVDYMPPEALRGERSDARADVYALGCLLYEALAGGVPFPRAELVARVSAHLYQSPPLVSQARPELPRALDAVITKAMAKKPEERFATCTELAEAAAAVLRPRARSARPAGDASRPAHVHHLPMQPTPMIGRERELSEVGELLGDADIRLVTLVGPGGTGKTRLGIQAALESADGVAGVFFVNLAPLSDPALVVPAIARALEVKEQAGEELLDTLSAQIGAQPMLLLLDNFEQVAAAAPAVAELRGRTERLKLLVTSRAPLHVSGEYEYLVPPLHADAAVTLFVERARAVAPGFAPKDRALVREICHRLDDLPLAIELAAARIKLLPEQALLERLRQRFKLLTGGPRDHDERQRTLRATIDWSYDLLSTAEQKLLRRLAPFAGGRTLEAIEDVCDPDGEIDVLDAVASLIDKSLLDRRETADDSPRFVMLETVQAYAAERLAQCGETERFCRRHAEYFLALAERAEAELRGPEQARWQEILELEQDNLRTAMEWSLHAEDRRVALEIAGRLWRFWFSHGHLREGRQWLEAGIANGPAGAVEARARALTGIAHLAIEQGDLDGAEHAALGALALYRELGDERSEGDALGLLADLIALRGDLAGARALYEQAVGVARASGELRQLAANLYYVAETARLLGDPDAAEAPLIEAMALFTALEDAYGQGGAGRALAAVAVERGEFDRALVLLDEAAEMTLTARYVAGQLAVIDEYARLFAKVDELEAAARMWAVHDHVVEEIGRGLVQPDEAAARDAARAAVRVALGVEAYARASTAGASMSLEEAIGWARGTSREETRPA